AAWRRSGTSPPSAAPWCRSQRGRDRTASSPPSGSPPPGSPQQRLELVFTHPLAPTRQRRTVKHQRMLEKFLAAEVLEVRVLHPPMPQTLGGRAVGVLEDR